MKNFCIKTAALAVFAVFAAAPAVPANAYGVVWWHGDEWGERLGSKDNEQLGGVGVIFNLRNRAQAERWARVQCERSRAAGFARLEVDPKRVAGFDKPNFQCKYQYFEKNCAALGKLPTKKLAGTDKHLYHTVHTMGAHSHEDAVVADYYADLVGDYGPEGHKYGPPAEAHARKSFLDTCSAHRPARECRAKAIRAGCDTNNSGKHHYGEVKRFDRFVADLDDAYRAGRIPKNKDGHLTIE